MTGHWSFHWMIKQLKNLADTKSVKVQFTKDQVKERASFQVYSAKNTNLGILTFHTSMVRYAKDRYLDIELILEDESGLKIPKSSVTKKRLLSCTGKLSDTRRQQ